MRQTLEANKKMLEDQIVLLSHPKYEAQRWKLRLWITKIEMELEWIAADPLDKGDFWNKYGA